MWNLKRPQIAKNNLEREDQCQRTHISQFQNLLQSYINENSEILTSRQKYRAKG